VLDDVVRDYTALDARNRQLDARHQSLQNEHAVLQNAYLDLNKIYEGLQTNYADLNDRYNNLEGRYTALEQAYQKSVRDYDALQRIAVVPPYIYISGRQVEFAFVKTNEQIVTWSIPFDTLEASLERGNRSRQNPTYLTLGLGDQQITVMDFRPYVDPAPFEDVVASLYYASPSEEAFLYETWHIVSQLSLYSYEISETPRYPLETFLAGGGDCEDNAILFASMVMAAPVDWDVYLVYMDGQNPDKPQGSNHVIAYVETGARKYWVETTSPDIMQPYTHGVTGWYYMIE
jgi:hypothetical protein